jgi:Leucine-rich repeat (LRR) protein
MASVVNHGGGSGGSGGTANKKPKSPSPKPKSLSPKPGPVADGSQHSSKVDVFSPEFFDHVMGPARTDEEVQQILRAVLDNGDLFGHILDYSGSLRDGRKGVIMPSSLLATSKDMTSSMYGALGSIRNLSIVVKNIEAISNTMIKQVIPHVANLRIVEGLKDCKSSTVTDKFESFKKLKALSIAFHGILPNRPLSQLKTISSLFLDVQNMTAPKMPPVLFQMTNIKKLIFRGCAKLVSLPDSFGNLTDLQDLRFLQCEMLEKLPISISKLTSLTTLGFQHCGSLRRLPETFGSLTNLKSLGIAYSKLAVLPESVCNLAGLTSMLIYGSPLLRVLFVYMRTLPSLTNLSIQCNPNRDPLPDNLGDLTRLTMLSITRAGGLMVLPESVGGLTGLRYMDLNGCTGLTSLPQSFGNLTNLCKLDVRNCSSLRLSSNQVAEILQKLKNLDVVSRLSLLGAALRS